MGSFLKIVLFLLVITIGYAILDAPDTQESQPLAADGSEGVVRALEPEVSGDTEEVAVENDDVKTVASVANSHQCATGHPVTGRFAISASDVNFREGPGVGYERVINRRASEVMGHTQYRILSQAYVLQGICETDEWLEGRIILADGMPAKWERGWVNKQYVRRYAGSSQQTGMLWDIENASWLSDADKAIMECGARKVLNDEQNCAAITDGDKSVSRENTYYVNCTPRRGGGAFNVWFTPEDIEEQANLGVPEPLAEGASREACLREIQERVIHRASLDIHQFMGYATRIYNNGNREIIQEFDAANAFGHRKEYRARCLIDPAGLIELSISEK